MVGLERKGWLWGWWRLFKIKIFYFFVNRKNIGKMTRAQGKRRQLWVCLWFSDNETLTFLDTWIHVWSQKIFGMSKKIYVPNIFMPKLFVHQISEIFKPKCLFLLFWTNSFIVSGHSMQVAFIVSIYLSEQLHSCLYIYLSLVNYPFGYLDIYLTISISSHTKCKYNTSLSLELCLSLSQISFSVQVKS